MSEVPFINLEYIFVKIYDFLIYIKNVILTGSFSASSGGGSDFASSFAGIGSWIVTIMTFVIIVLIIWAIYIRVRILEVDEFLDAGYKSHFVKPEIKKTQINEQWKIIANHFASQNPNDWRAAIMDADSMLDQLVTSLGYTGDSLGEKLTTIRLQDFPTLQIAWEAHKIRNKIAHEGVAYQLTEREKELARKNFEAVFRNAGLI